MLEDPHDEREGRGRSAKKREAQAVEALAVRLVEASEALCKNLPLPEKLRDSLDQARSIKSRSARKRQLKHLAGLLRRDEDSAVAVQAALDSVGRSNRAERDFFHHIEELRDALCDPDRFAEAIESAAEELPGLDRQTFTGLAQRVHRNGDKRASREIFRRLRALTEPSSRA
ncbi:MAG: ribosome biogenesis factor YjgA [Acidobacteriota bacterium]